MNFFMTGQEKCDLLIQVTAWAGLTTYYYNEHHYYHKNNNHNNEHFGVGIFFVCSEF